MWSKILLFASLIDLVAVVISVVLAFGAVCIGRVDLGIFWMLTAMFMGRGQVAQVIADSIKENDE